MNHEAVKHFAWKKIDLQSANVLNVWQVPEQLGSDFSDLAKKWSEHPSNKNGNAKVESSHILLLGSLRFLALSTTGLSHICPQRTHPQGFNRIQPCLERIFDTRLGLGPP